MDPFKKSLGINFGSLFSVNNNNNGAIVTVKGSKKTTNNEKEEEGAKLQIQDGPKTPWPPNPVPEEPIPPKPTWIGEIFDYPVTDWTWDPQKWRWIPVLGNRKSRTEGTGGGNYPSQGNPGSRGGSSGGSSGRPTRGTSDPDQGGSPMGEKSTVRRNPHQKKTPFRFGFFAGERPFNYSNTTSQEHEFENNVNEADKYATLLKFGKQFGWTLEKILEARKKKPNFEWHCDKNLNPDQHFCCPEHVQQAINDFYQSLFDDPMIQRNPRFLQCLSENWSKTYISCMPDSLYQEDERKQSRYDPNENYNDFALARNGFLRIPVDSIVTWNIKSDGSTVAEINSEFKNHLILRLVARCAQLANGLIDNLDYSHIYFTLLMMGLTQENSFVYLKKAIDIFKNRNGDPCTQGLLYDTYYNWQPKTGTVWMRDKNGNQIEPPIISNDSAWKWPC